MTHYTPSHYKIGTLRAPHCFRTDEPIFTFCFPQNRFFTPRDTAAHVRQVARNLHFRLARFARRTVSASAMSFDESAAFSGRHRITLCRPLPLRTLRRMRHSLPKSVRICCLLGFIKPICANTFGILHLYLLVRRADFYVLLSQNLKMVLYLRILPYYRTSGCSQLASERPRLFVRNTLARRTDFFVLHIAKRFFTPRDTAARCAAGCSQLASTRPRFFVRNTLARRTDFFVLHIAKRKNGSLPSFSAITKRTRKRPFCYGGEGGIRTLATV